MQWACKCKSSIPFFSTRAQGNRRRWFAANGFVWSASANAAAFSPASSMPPPKVGLQRVDENLDVPFLLSSRESTHREHLRRLDPRLRGAKPARTACGLRICFGAFIMTPKSLSRTSAMFPQRNDLKLRSIFPST